MVETTDARARCPHVYSEGVGFVVTNTDAAHGPANPRTQREYTLAFVFATSETKRGPKTAHRRSRSPQVADDGLDAPAWHNKAPQTTTTPL